MNSNRNAKNKNPAAVISAWIKKNISAIIVGIIVVALTPFVNNLYSAHEAKKLRKNTYLKSDWGYQRIIRIRFLGIQ